MATTETICTFYVDDLFLGVDVQVVQEIIRYQELTRVPLAPPVIAGMINLRGEIVVAIDLRRRLGLSAEGAPKCDTSVVVQHDDATVSLLIDEIGDVLEVDDAAFEPPPQTVPTATRELVRHVCKLDGQLLLVLDIARVVTVEKGDDTQLSPAVMA
jgi:purine-binding chemotaxis protein CheW